VNTSAKARLISVTIRIPDPDRHQNFIISRWPIANLPSKISCKSACKFLHKAANRQTDKQTATITLSFLAEVKSSTVPEA